MMILNPYRFSSGGSGGDPYWANVSSLLHFDGSNGSTTFTDQKGKTWTAVGNAQISTARYKFGGASGLFDGSGDYITSPTHADFGFGTGDFTVECFIYPTANNKVIFDTRPFGAAVYYIDSSGKLGVFTSVSGAQVTSGSVTLNDWQHVAWCRASGVMRLFIGGVSGFSGANTADMGVSGTGRVGAQNDGNLSFSGNIDEFRVTKGVGRYTSNFTPPTAAFPDS